MNYLMLMAGGIGSRVGASVPKQFIEINGKPIIAYTMMAFQSHPEIDGIILICVKGFESKLGNIAKENSITKVLKIVEGGVDYEHSIMNGVKALNGIAKDDDVIQIHWAASPFVSAEIISDNIRVCKEKGNAMSACKSYVLYGKNNGDHAEDVLNRDTFMTLSAPQSFLFKNIQNLYKLAEEKHVFEYVEPHTTNIMAELGVPIYFSKGNQTNIKITTKEDLDLFEGWLLLKNKK
jgi:2-C-methyl-D-erythritol 4-phosphate cytidylyltransferase